MQDLSAYQSLKKLILDGILLGVKEKFWREVGYGGVLEDEPWGLFNKHTNLHSVIEFGPGCNLILILFSSVGCPVQKAGMWFPRVWWRLFLFF